MTQEIANISNRRASHSIRRPDIAIVGAGVGGLTLWLALRERGLCAEVYEQAHELTEIGAAVALSANATRELGRLGVLDEVVAASTEPTELVYRDGRTGERIAAHPIRLNGAYRARFGASYCGIHRADLQRALSATSTRSGCIWAGVSLASPKAISHIELLGRRTAEAEVVIAADGVRSAARRFVAGDERLLFSRTSGFRGIAPAARLPTLPDPQAIQFWMGPYAHLLHYAIGADGGHVNFLAVVEGPHEWANPEKGLVESTLPRRSPCSRAGTRR